MTITDAFLTDPRVTELLDRDIMSQLAAIQPSQGISSDAEVGHWIAQTAACLQQMRSLAQRVRELEADA